MTATVADLLEAEVVESEKNLSQVKDKILKLRSDHLQTSSLDGSSRIVNIEPAQFYTRDAELAVELTNATREFHECLKRWSDSK